MIHYSEIVISKSKQCHSRETFSYLVIPIPGSQLSKFLRSVQINLNSIRTTILVLVQSVVSIVDLCSLKNKIGRKRSLVFVTKKRSVGNETI